MSKMFEKDDTPSWSDGAIVLRWAVWAAVIGTAAFAMLHFAGVLGTVASAPGRVVNKTMETGNIIASYEWFYDTHAQYQSRVGQIKDHAGATKAEADAKERARLSIELSAMRQSCRDLATKYNANSEKANKSIFKSGALPDALPTDACEAQA
jgi:hypothetical protein